MRAFLAMAMLAIPYTPILAQDPLTIQRLSGPIEIDGVSDEAAWQSIEPFPLTVYQPTFEAEPTERTEIRVAYDDTHIYVAGRLYDSDPTGVRANTLYRDQYSGDDILAIVLDTFDDNENAVWFLTTPAGVRLDMSVAADAEFSSGRAMNSDWNSFWDVASTQTEEGWFAEMRIPFASLSFQEQNGRVVMGLITYRFIARKNERHLFPSIPPKWGMGFAKPSQAQQVVFEDVFNHNPVYVTPYVLGGVDRISSLNAAETAYGVNNDFTNEAGIDLKYNPTDNIALDLTVNTDFAQVEADNQQFNLTRFSLFFPEKRQFFQARAGVFDFSTSGFGRLFHSRRIGLDDGSPVRILGGARAVGRAGSWDVGMLNMQTARSDAHPSENFGVARLRRQVLNAFSYVGGMLTTRAGDDGSYNVAYGFDGIFRPVGDEYLTVKWAQTFEDDIAGGVTALDASRIIAKWERRNNRGLSYAFGYERSGPDYNPGLGFELRRDFFAFNNAANYQWFPGAQSPFRSLGFGHESFVFLRNGDNSVESVGIAPGFEIETKPGTMIRGSYTANFEDVDEAFEFGDGVGVPVGEYWFHEAAFNIESSRAALIRPRLSGSAGTFYDGWRVSTGTGADWNPSRHLQLGLSYELNLIRFPDRNESLNAHLASLNIQAALNRHLSWSTLLQYSSAGDLAGINARVRYHFGEGNDLWFVYNEGFNTHRTVLAGPRLPVSDARSLLAKYTYTFY